MLHRETARALAAQPIASLGGYPCITQTRNVKGQRNKLELEPATCLALNPIFLRDARLMAQKKTSPKASAAQTTHRSAAALTTRGAF